MFLEENRKRIEQEYKNRTLQFPKILDRVTKKLMECTECVALAMKYLYGNMPYSDMGNYSFETFLDYALHGVTLWEESQEVRELSEEMYLNYVLYHRINEEEITPCRSFFCAQLKNRLQGMSSREAALEVNYWCAQEATYQSTDDRTLSPMTVYRRGNGRCGEESTFTVSALRSVGIPARQVYVPKWSHCDDNHAWVEVWCDGKWGFMGACEPEPILNKGWFTNASSRAMMVNSRWFDSLKPTEEIIGQSGMVTMVNQLQRYAKAEEIIISVKDIDGQPVQGANVVFEILNYSEFSQIAETATDEHGIARLTTGLGSICIRVRKEEKYAERMMNTKEEKECDIVLEVSPVKESWQSFDMIAPKDAPVNTNMPTKEQRKEGNAKEAKATQKRRTKVETAVWKEREDFLNKEKSYGPLRKDMLRVLTEKDQTDCICSVLEEHLQYALAYQKNMDQELFVRYVLNPRIADEVLTKYRESIEGAFTEEQKQIFRQQPKRIWEYIKENIHACKEKERDSLITVPAALLKLRVGSEQSQKVLFVAIARTLGIPARLHFADGEMEYFAKGEFHRISQAAIKNCTLVLEKEGVDWIYFQNWTLGKLKEGRYQTLDLSGEKGESNRLELQLEPGTYRLLTTNRLPNGNQFANRYECTLARGNQKTVSLQLRQADLGDMLENNALPPFELYGKDNRKVEGQTLLKDQNNIMMWLEESKEPTEHILNELMERSEEVRKHSEKIYFVLQNKEALQDPTIAKAVTEFPNIQIYYDDFAHNVELLGRRMYVDFEKLPLILVTKGIMNGIYATSGYNVGTGDMLLRLMNV